MFRRLVSPSVSFPIPLPSPDRQYATMAQVINDRRKIPPFKSAFGRFNWMVESTLLHLRYLPSKALQRGCHDDWLRIQDMSPDNIKAIWAGRPTDGQSSDWIWLCLSCPRIRSWSCWLSFYGYGVAKAAWGGLASKCPLAVAGPGSCQQNLVNECVLSTINKTGDYLAVTLIWAVFL